MSSTSVPAKKAWRVRRAKKAVETRKARNRQRERREIGKWENRRRKTIQVLVMGRLRKWWRREYLEGPPSKPIPKKCIVCGDSTRLGLAIHHISPSLKKGDKGYSTYKNQAPLCGTCHNIITYKKSKNVDDILNEIDRRHNEAVRKELFKT